MGLLERCQTPCPAHATLFGRLQAAGVRTAHAFPELDDCRDCRAATLTAARAYATHEGRKARTEVKPSPRCRRCRASGPKPLHTHNAEGGFVFYIPGPPVPGPGSGVDIGNYVRSEA